MSSRLSRFFACFLCFSLLIAFSPMSAIKAEADEVSFAYIPSSEWRSMIGDSISGTMIYTDTESGDFQTINGIDFEYFSTISSTGYPVAAYQYDSTSEWLYLTGNLMDRPMQQDVPILVYSFDVPDIIANLPNQYRAEFSLDFDVTLSNVKHCEMLYGFSMSGQDEYIDKRVFPYNYVAVNGTSYQAANLIYPYSTDTFANFMCNILWGENNEYYGSCRCPQLRYYMDLSSPQTVNVSKLHGQGLKPIYGKFFLFIFPPYVDTGYQYVPNDKLPSWIQNEKIVENTEDIKQMLHIIVSGSGASGLGKEDFVSLWVPSTAQLLTHEQSLRVMLHDTFGSAYDAEELLQDAVDAISEDNVEPLTHLDLPALSVPVDGQQITIMQAQEVPLKPEGFDTLFTVIASIIDIVCTFAVINMLRKRFEKGVLENDG